MKIESPQSEYSCSQIIKKLDLIENLVSDLAHHLLFWKQEYFSLLLDYNELNQKHEEAQAYIANHSAAKQVVDLPPFLKNDTTSSC